MDFIHQKQYSDEISRLRYDERITEAIEKCLEATKEFPESNFFYKLLGDLYVQENRYHDAAKAYLEQLKRLSTRPEQFKTFARFYKSLTTKVTQDFLNQYQNDILAAVKKGEIAQNIHEQLVENFGDVFVTDARLLKLLEKSNDDRNFEEIKQFVDSTQDNNAVRALLLYQIDAVGNARSRKIEGYLVSVAEKKKMYPEALQLIGKMLKKRQKANPTIIRTLLRISRKQGDYSYAESVLDFNDALIERSDFNVQYELVYYFDIIQDNALLNKTLKRMHRSAEGSIPIARTLYNFYLNFNRFDEAQAVSEHIKKLTADARKSKFSKQQNPLQQRSEEQLESEQVIWQKLKELVSEQEHNRQMVALRDLLKGFSHELGQPITNIRYSVQLQQMKIQRGVSTPDEIEKLFATILDQTARVGTLLDRFRPIVSSKSQPTLFSVKDCISQVFDDLSDRLKDSAIDYHINVRSDSHLHGDQVQFSQVFYNLVLNSMQAIGKNGNIQVQLSETSDEITILFSDTGPGIPIENSKKIFEPFFSTKDPTAGNGGEGLGLFVVWNILRMFGGAIQVNLKHKNGAQFIIKIPVYKEAKDSEPHINN